MNRSAQQLGRLAKGKPKTLTKAERNRRAMSLAVARAKRWPNKSNVSVQAEARFGADSLERLVRLFIILMFSGPVDF
jgi:hypothetical protein